MAATITTILIVYFAVNLVLAVISAILNFETDRADEKRFWGRFILYILFGVIIFVASLVIVCIEAIKDRKNEEGGKL